MVEPHIIEEDKIITCYAWVRCAKCNNALHRILPGIDTPYWWCKDEKRQLQPEQEIEVEYLEP